MSDACETPMSDHVKRFWELLEAEFVHIVVNIQRLHDEGQPPHWDSSTFSNEVAKAVVAQRRPQAGSVQEPPGYAHGDAQSPPKNNAWQPISTAPKDGSRTLIAWVTSDNQWRYSFARWLDDVKHYCLEDMDAVVGARFWLSVPELTDAAMALSREVSPPMNDIWQPIETAPKDGTQIIVCSDYSDDVAIVRWDARKKDWLCLADGMAVIESQDDFRTDLLFFSVPSHWQPCPIARRISTLPREESHG